MGSFSLTRWPVVLMIILIAFGTGKAPRVMGDAANRSENFQTNMRESKGAASALSAVATTDDRAPSRSR